MTFQQQKGGESLNNTDTEEMVDPNQYISHDNKVQDYEDDDFTGHFNKKIEEAMNFVQSSELGEEEEE